MAYGRRSSSRSRSGGYSRGRSTARAPARRSYSSARRASPRRAATRRTTGRATGGRAQTVRIVIEGLPGSPAARQNPFARTMGLVPAVEQRSPRKAKL